MEERNNLWASVALMALVGGAITALLYTQRGRQSLTRFEHALDDFGNSLEQLRGAVQKAGIMATRSIEVASEGVEVVSGLLGKAEPRPGSSATH